MRGMIAGPHSLFFMCGRGRRAVRIPLMLGPPVDPGMRDNRGGRRTMTITLSSEQERVLMDAINSGLAHTTDEALDQALNALRLRLLPATAAPTRTPEEIRVWLDDLAA